MKTIERVAVIGAGTMGRQIALQIARHGFAVNLYDVDGAALDEARKRISGRSYRSGSPGESNHLKPRRRFSPESATSVILRRLHATLTWR